MTVLERNIEEHLAAEDVGSLHAYLRGLLDGGLARPDLEHALEGLHKHFQQRGDERLADLALDGLDLVTGWCAPGRAISKPHAA